MSTRKSLAFSFLDRYASLAIGIVASMILARLLTPAEVGIFSVTMVLLALVATVRDLGAGQYLLQEKELTHDRIRAVWAVQLGVGVILGLLVSLGSRPFADFYNEPRMRDIMLLLALNYVVNPLGSVTYAWLMREMRYDAIAIIRFSATLSGATVSVWLASRGHGPISLAWGSLCSTIVNAGMSVFFRPREYPWIPGLREIPRVLSFGTKVTATSIINTLATGAPEFFLGKLQSLTAAGFFSRANGLVAMFARLVTDAVYTVALSLFSKEARESRDSAQSFLSAFSYITALSWSFAVVLIFLAQPAIRLLYGAQWDTSVDLARWLAGGMAFGAPVPLCMAALIGSGAVSHAFRATAISTAATIALAAAGAAGGLLEMGVAMLLAACIGAVVWFSITKPVVGFRWRALTGIACKSAVVAVGAGLAPAAAFLAFGAYPTHSVLPMATGGVGAAIGLSIAVRLVDHPLRVELERALLRFKEAVRPRRR